MKPTLIALAILALFSPLPARAQIDVGSLLPDGYKQYGSLASDLFSGKGTTAVTGAATGALGSAFGSSGFSGALGTQVLTASGLSDYLSKSGLPPAVQNKIIEAATSGGGFNLQNGIAALTTALTGAGLDQAAVATQISALGLAAPSDDTADDRSISKLSPRRGSTAFKVRASEDYNLGYQKMFSEPNEIRSATNDAPMVTSQGHPLIMPGPMGAFSDIMESKVYGDLNNALLSSKTSIIKSAMAMTEPAIFAAYSNASQEGQLALMNRYLSEIQMLQQLNLYPDTQQPVGQAYYACIWRMMTGQYEVHNGATVRAMSWPEAQTYCSGDRIVALAAPLGGGFDEINNPAPNGFGAQHDPHQSHEDQATGGITLWSYLFRDNDPTVLADAGTVAALKGAFKTFIGNIQFNFDGAVGLSGTRTIVYSKVPGAITTEKYLQDTVKDRYQRIFKMLNTRCLDIRNNKGKNKLSDGGGAPAVVAFPEADFRALSSSGFEFKPDYRDALFMIWRMDNGANCDELALGTGSKPYDYEHLSDGTATSIPELQAHVYYLARKIAFGQMLDVLLRAEQYVKAFTPGSSNANFVRQRGLALVYEAAGTEKLREASEKNSDKLNQSITMIMGDIAMFKQSEDFGKIFQSSSAESDMSKNVLQSGR